MRVTIRKRAFNPLLTLLAAMLLVASGAAHSQATTRSFQMALWGTLGAGKDADITTFFPTAGQPDYPTKSILMGWTYSNTLYNTVAPVAQVPYDWSRIVAVQIDEPYKDLDGYLLDPTECDSLPSSDVQAIDAELQARAAELKKLNPRARFWVNFTNVEANWMVFCVSPQVFNKPYIDVISTDWYSANVPGVVSTFYDMVLQSPATPSQQVALIPGVFASPSNQQQYLGQYFEYANNANTTCNLPLGTRGVTGFYDGCPVWIVTGFLANNTTDGSGTVYEGLLDNSSAENPIRAQWESTLALPLVPALAHQRTRAQILWPALQPAIQLLKK